jgi:hydroxyethylthiazole kinase-like uncharacterized protein yjeF
VIPVLTGEEMRKADSRTISGVGLPGAVLMENAGAAVASLVAARFAAARHVVVLCGRGNNGGDGFVAARRLGTRAEAVVLGGRAGVAGDAALHLNVLERSGGRLLELADERAWRAFEPRLDEADLIVDAVLGTGLRAAPSASAGTCALPPATSWVSWWSPTSAFRLRPWPPRSRHCS